MTFVKLAAFLALPLDALDLGLGLGFLGEADASAEVPFAAFRFVGILIKL